MKYKEYNAKMEYREPIVKYNWITNPVGAIFLTITGFLVTIFLSSVFAHVIPNDLSSFPGKLTAGLCIAVISIFIVYGLRKCGNQSLSGLHIHFSWSVLPEMITGI